MKLYNITLDSPIVHENVSIDNYNSTLRLDLGDGVYLDDDDKYINSFCPSLVNDTFDSILIGGLVLGLIPYYVQQNKTYSKLTVVEKNINIINAVAALGVLNDTVEVVNDDFLTYTPTQNYDYIISDYHWGHPTKEPNWETEIESIKTKYTTYLNTNGKLLVPLVKYEYTS